MITTVPQVVGFVCHARVGVDQEQVQSATNSLRRRGFQVWTHGAQQLEASNALVARLDGTRLLVSVGGDGTLLWVAQQAALQKVPVLGVNAGRLGFLTEVQLPEVEAALERWLAGDFVTDRRPLLRAHVEGDDRNWTALNEVLVQKVMPYNVIRIEVEVDENQAGRFDCDGAVISTPTGSTGYALSLGGPLIHPEVPATVFMPLNPHTLFNRPVVVSDRARISLRLPSGSAVLICDGQPAAELHPGARVQVSKSENSVELIRLGAKRNFFDVLQSRLHWGQPLVDGQ